MSGSTSRRKGHQFERDVAARWRDMGFDATTSRYTSRATDDAGVDLCGTAPFAIQCKAWKSAPAYHDVLAAMPQGSDFNVILHKRPHKGTVAVMSADDFEELVQMLRKERII